MNGGRGASCREAGYLMQPRLSAGAALALPPARLTFALQQDVPADAGRSLPDNEIEPAVDGQQTDQRRTQRRSDGQPIGTRERAADDAQRGNPARGTRDQRILGPADEDEIRLANCFGTGHFDHLVSNKLPY